MVDFLSCRFIQLSRALVIDTNTFSSSFLSMACVSRNECRRIQCRIFRALRLRLTPSKSWLPRIPIELLQDIFPRLPLPSQVCLALSCKDFYNISSPVFQASELQFPRLSQTRKDPDDQDDDYYIRINLLRQLEDNKYELTKPACKRYCSTFPRLFDICPCITLTPRARAHIVRHLERRTNGKLIPDLISKGQLKDSHTDTGEHTLLHESSAYNIQVKTKLIIEKGDILMVCTQYEVPVPVPNMNSVYLCRHERLEKILYASQNTNPRYCTYCNTRITKLSNNSNVPGSIMVQTTRYLGRGEWPFGNYDEKLCLQARLTRDVPF